MVEWPEQKHISFQWILQWLNSKVYAYMMHVHRKFFSRFKGIRWSLILYSYGFWNGNEILSFPFSNPYQRTANGRFFFIENDRYNDAASITFAWETYGIRKWHNANGFLFMTSISDAILFENLSLFFIVVIVVLLSLWSAYYYAFSIHYSRFRYVCILSLEIWNWHFSDFPHNLIPRK